MTDNSLEDLREFYEQQYRTKDSTAEVVVALGYVDYTDHPVIKEYEQRGFILHDAIVFGRGEEWGEVLIFIKNNNNIKSISDGSKKTKERAGCSNGTQTVFQ